MMKRANWKMIAAAAMMASLYIQTPAMAEEEIDMIIADETVIETEAEEVQTEAAGEILVIKIADISEAAEDEIPAEVTKAADLADQNSDFSETEADKAEETNSDETKADETAETGSDETNADNAEDPEASRTEETEAAGTTEPELTGNDEAADTESDEAEQPGTEEETKTPAAETEAEVSEAEESYKTDLSFSNSEVTVTVTASEAAHLPENAELKVRKLEEGSEEYEAAKAAAVSSCGTNESASYSFYSVSILVDGSEIEIADGTVSVQIEFTNVQKSETATQKVLRIDSNGVSDVTAQTAAGCSISSVAMTM